MSKESVQKPRLGRGLSSLINPAASYVIEDQPVEAVSSAGSPAAQAGQVTHGQTAAQTASPTPIELPVEQISPNPYQPRREFKPLELQELCDSIVQQGILQPLIVARSEQTDAATPYVLIAGERRLRAAKLAGLASVPCVIKFATRQQMVEWALVENIQRENLNPLERALAYRHYMDRFSFTQVQIAEKLGQARATVANFLRLLDLPSDTQELLSHGKISFGHAKVLLGLNNPAQQEALAKKVAQDDLSVRQLEGVIAVLQMQANPQAAADKKSAKAKPPYLRDLEEQLTHVVGTRVIIHQGRSKNSGKLVVEYYSLEDFDRISKLLGLQVQS